MRLLSSRTGTTLWTWCLLAPAIGLSFLAQPCNAVTHAYDTRADRAQFDATVALWKKKFPHLADDLSDDDFNRIWDHMSGASNAKAKVNTAGPIDAIPSADAPPSLSSASDQDVAKARKVVDSTVKKASKFNREHTEIHRNSYKLKPEDRARTRAAAPKFMPSKEEKNAAALVAEADAKEMHANGTFHRAYEIPVFDADGNKPTFRTQDYSNITKRDGDDYWLAALGAQYPGNFPFGGDDKYKVFRNVKDYGAKGDGTTDDTFAIFVAMYDGSRCGNGCGGTTVKGATVYFPPGTYLVSSPIISLYNTQMIGHPYDIPVLRAAKSFSGLGVITSDVYIENGNGDTWYLNTANFLRQVRNFIIDTKDVAVDDIKAFHWQVAQATSVQNVHISMRTGSNHIGFFIENGSGGTLDSISTDGGAIGINCGNQQFTSKQVVITNANVGVSMLWDWGWTWQQLLILSTKYGIQFQTSDFTGGSLIVLDSSFWNVDTGISIDQAKDAVSLTVKNLHYINVGTTIESKASGAILKGGSGQIDNWILGNAYEGPDYKQNKINGDSSAAATIPDTPSLQASSGSYFIRARPQYESLLASEFWSAGIEPKMSDGKTDATALLNLYVLLAHTLHRVLHLPAGSYIITDTIEIPSGLKIVGTCWSQLVATGDKFNDMNNPRPMVRVGKTGGEIGSVEISDILFTVKGPTAGAVLVEWNIAAAEQGSAAMWDSHFRVGGAMGSDLQKDQCPKLSGSVNDKCIAASLLLHLTETSTAYLDNIWAWTADHDLDDPPKSETQIDIYSARGILIESRGPTWLYGTSSEHNVLYQYAISNAANIFMGMIQTESPYYLPHPPAPKPFESAVGKFSNDPDFKDCNDDSCRVSWALYVAGSSHVFVAGAGLYSWFYGNYDRGCVASQSCQQRLVYVDDSSSVIIYSLYTVGAKEMVTQAKAPSVMAKDNLRINQDPFVSIIATYNKRSPNFLGSGGIFYEGGPDLAYGTCDQPSQDYLKLMDWFFKEKYDSHKGPWETQMIHLFADLTDIRCDNLIRPAQCQFDIKCVDNDAASKSNYANAVWALKVTKNYFISLDAQKTIVNDLVIAQGGSIGGEIAKAFQTKPDEKDALTKMLEAISKIIGLGAWGLEKGGGKVNKKAAGYLGDLGTVFDFVKDFVDNNPDEPADIKEIVDKAVTNMTTVTQKTCEQAAISFYDNGSNIGSWKDIGIFKDGPYSHDVPNFFADGRYTDPVGGTVDQKLKDDVLSKMKSSLVSIALKAKNYYIIADFFYKPDCNPDSVKDGAKFRTARWIDGHCYALFKPGEGWTGYEIRDPEFYTHELDKDEIDSLGDFDFDFDQIYQTSIKCQESHNAYDAQVTQKDFNQGLLGEEDPLPGSCLYTFPVIYVNPTPGQVTDKTPCVMANGSGGKAGHDYLPDNLKKIFGAPNFCKIKCEPPNDPEKCKGSGCPVGGIGCDPNQHPPHMFMSNGGGLMPRFAEMGQ